MDISSVFLTIIIGAVCGYVASRLLGGDGFGFLGNIFVGIMGGFIGELVFKYLQFGIPFSLLQTVISSIFGAIIFIIVLSLARRIVK